MYIMHKHISIERERDRYRERDVWIIMTVMMIIMRGDRSRGVRFAAAALNT